MDDQKETLEGLTENYKTETSSSNSEISGMEFNELQMSSYNPYEDEHETRPLPDGKCVEGFLSQLFDDVDDLFGESRLEEQGHNIMWGLVNVFDRQAKQTNNALDKNQREMRNLMDQQDGSEVKSNQLEQVQSDCLKFEETLEVFEKMRDHASLKYTHYTNRDWMPYSGSKVNTKAQTASMVDSRDYLRQKAIAKNNTLIPEGRKFVITGGADYNDHEKIWNTLSNTLAKNPDMVLIHGGNKTGVEAIAAGWATRNKVPHIAFKPDFNKHNKAAPFKRNDAMLNEHPTGVLEFPGNGISENLGDKARKLHIPTMKIDRDGSVTIRGRK